MKERFLQVADYMGLSVRAFEFKCGLQRGNISNMSENGAIGSDKMSKIIDNCPDINIEWLLTGNGEMLKAKIQPITPRKKEKEIEETRPRIPYDAAAGSLSVALDGITINHCEQLPVIRAFAKYDFTIIAKGDSMSPEFHSGDELACLYVKDSKFIQWGRVHVLDTSQGVVVKRIFKGDNCVICRSDNPNYPEFNIDGSELYNIALVIGVIRRY